MRAILLTAMLALVLLPVVSAGPDPPTVNACYRDPCVGYSATGNGGSNNQLVCEYAFDGACVGAHEGTDGVVVGFGAGITSCHYGVMNGHLVYGCYF